MDMRSGLDKFSRMMNPPIKVRWAGWESDTYHLGGSGWQLSMREDVQYNMIELAMKHPQFNVYGIGRLNCQDFNYMDLDHRRDILREAGFNIQYMSYGSPKFQMINTRDYQFDNFQAVDTEPAYIDTEIKTLEDFRMFTPVHGKEIVVMKRKVPELIKEVLKLQEPKQAELREQQRKEIRQIIRNGKTEDLKDVKQEECVARLIAL